MKMNKIVKEITKRVAIVASALFIGLAGGCAKGNNEGPAAVESQEGINNDQVNLDSGKVSLEELTEFWNAIENDELDQKLAKLEGYLAACGCEEDEITQFLSLVEGNGGSIFFDNAFIIGDNNDNNQLNVHSEENNNNTCGKGKDKKDESTVDKSSSEKKDPTSAPKNTDDGKQKPTATPKPTHTPKPTATPKPKPTPTPKPEEIVITPETKHDVTIGTPGYTNIPTETPNEVIIGTPGYTNIPTETPNEVIIGTPGYTSVPTETPNEVIIGTPGSTNNPIPTPITHDVIIGSIKSNSKVNLENINWDEIDEMDDIQAFVKIEGCKDLDFLEI